MSHHEEYEKLKPEKVFVDYGDGIHTDITELSVIQYEMVLSMFSRIVAMYIERRLQKDIDET